MESICSIHLDALLVKRIKVEFAEIADGNGHIDALSTTLTDFGRHVRYASEQASELKDVDTAAIFTEIARGIDKWLWFVETSQQSGS